MWERIGAFILKYFLTLLKDWGADLIKIILKRKSTKEEVSQVERITLRIYELEDELMTLDVDEAKNHIRIKEINTEIYVLENDLRKATRDLNRGIGQ